MVSTDKEYGTSAFRDDIDEWLVGMEIVFPNFVCNKVTENKKRDRKKGC